MICTMCGASEWMPVFHYDKPDKYESWVGLDSIKRGWYRCARCRFYQSYRDYDVSLLEKIYIDGYRSVGFRNESIEDAYGRIGSIPVGAQENHYR